MVLERMWQESVCIQLYRTKTEFAISIYQIRIVLNFRRSRFYGSENYCTRSGKYLTKYGFQYTKNLLYVYIFQQAGHIFENSALKLRNTDADYVEVFHSNGFFHGTVYKTFIIIFDSI